FRQIEFVGILKGTPQLALARQLVDFMLDRRFQEDIPLQMFVFPANRQAALPEVFRRHTRLAEQPVALPPEKIAANRERWIQAWTETVLR
ncbi:MAG: thiamine ABC transporter substrate-binding protein, partial [Desulfobacteraceae bacterium]